MDTDHTPAFPWALTTVLAMLFVLSLVYVNLGNIVGGAEPWMVATNVLLLAVPLALLYGSIGLLVAAWGQQRSQGQVNRRLATWIYRAPRIAGILIVMFVSLFALDVFSEKGTIWQLLGAYVIHALPAIVLAALLALAWRWEWIGFIAFLFAAVFFLAYVSGDLSGALGIVLIFSGPMAAIAILFWANWKWKKSLHI